MTLPSLLTEAEAAEALRLCTRTLRKARQRGDLSFVQYGSKILYSPDDIDRFIERNRVCPSTSVKARRTGSTRSRSTVFDFEEAQKKRESEKLQRSKQKNVTAPATSKGAKQDGRSQ